MKYLQQANGVIGSEVKLKAIMEKYVFDTPFALRDLVEISDVESLRPYIKTEWRDFRKELFGTRNSLNYLASQVLF